MSLKLSKELNERFALFLDHHSPQELSTGLRRMLLEYISERSKLGFDSNFEELICGLNDLMDLLDMAGRDDLKPEIRSMGLTELKN